MKTSTTLRLGAASTLAMAVAAIIGATPAMAKDTATPVVTPRATPPLPQQATPATTAQADDAEASDIVVTGFRASLENALDLKRRSNQIIDAITAEDIADFPDANLAESIQRLPGVSIDRDNGEGRTITVRGLGGDFQQTRLNGVDAQSAAGGAGSDSGANRSRGFDFNTFASELFGGVKITKSTAAVNDEGSLGAIIDLTTGRPLSFKKARYSFGAEAEYRENGKTINPRLTALVSGRLTDTLGILATVAYQKQEQQIDGYRRAIGAFDYAYRGAQLNGVTPATYGFARPSTAGTGATFGSDPAAYNLITPTTIIPALPSIQRQTLAYDRLGATVTAQWRPSSRTEIILDGVFSRYQQDSVQQGITTIGLNRNGTNTRVTQNTLRAANTANGLADRLALYANCVPSAIVNCAGTEGSATILPGTQASYNPNNLNTFDYYNATRSPGYIANAQSIAYYNELIGRPNTKIRAANVNAAGQADYLVLDDVDWRSYADAQFGKTDFYQGTLNATQEITDRFRAELTAGYSKSTFDATGLLAEFNAIDRDGYTFDERGDGKMPVFNPGFDVATPGNWSLVKGLSTIRYFTNTVSNEYKVARLNFSLDAIPDQLTLRFGGTIKQFDFESDQGRRNQSIEAINPTLAEAKLAITDLGQTVGFGQGLQVPGGTPTSFYAPDLDKFRQQFGIDCNCVNKWGDYRAVVDGRQRNSVTERDLSGFFQVDFNFDVLGAPLRGDVGMRVARTRVNGRGNVGGSDGVAGLPVSARNQYFDWLPSTNLTYEPARNLLVRFAAAKVIARPQLASLTPGTTAFPSGLPTNGSAPSLTVGNPYLSPFRATNLDLSFEKYFGRGGLVGVTFFSKNIDSFPQQIAAEVPLSAVFEPAVYQAVLASMPNQALRDYTNNGGVYAVRQFNDAPGGTIRGVELNVQSNFFFLPAPFDQFGVAANYTHIESKLNYLTGTALSTAQGSAASTAVNTFAEGPFLNTSPDAFNATFYFENSRFSARLSGAYRTRYVNRFPLASGTCSVGTTTNAGAACNSPVVADFGYNEDTLNLDFALGLNVTDWAKLSLEGRNLTNNPQYRTMYGANPVSQTYASTGRIITAGLRMTF